MLLSIHLLNIGGQLLLHQYLVYKSDKLFDEEVSKGKYSIDDLVEVKIPVHMPTIQDWNNYTYISGQVQFQNSCYNYVKLKMTRDTIYLMCVPNYQTTHLADHNIINARQIPDIPLSKKEHVPFGKINLTAYNYQSIHYRFSIPLIMVRKTVYGNCLITSNLFVAGTGEPPDPETAVS
jgi:hypothetical protein